MGNNVSKKFGSRILSDEEVRLTLPTYDKLLEQIEDMRDDNWDVDKSKKLHNQKINNISILGARGTGKTSILKSLINKLEEENKEDVILGKNIVLPMIVPENMSASSNLMSMILGLFKGIVDELEAKEESRSKECWFSKESDISKRYRELVRKFCFLQPDFKSVPIKQYTTENDYVEKSSQIFQADIEFMSYFNDFIDMLIETKEEKNERLIFVFIDDMDLSTQRCVDAVRTLLAYISHPRIVTVLAGDLETFEEALTLDFIRQEQMVRADIFETKFVVANGEKDKYLERKKTLTYEYLKKVMPVIYRHNLREWSLETRGNYIVKGNVGNAKSFVELLNICFSTLENPPIFQYFENEEDEGKNLPQMFHIFDHTARGLNAVYNVLLETYNIMQNGEEDKKFPQIKILLETIIGSNSLFNKYRKVIFEDIIKFGVDFEGTKIDCENFKSFIEKEFPQNEQEVQNAKYDKKSEGEANGSEKPNESKEPEEMNYKINSIKTKQRFRFFVLLDFSIRILEKNDILNEEIYLELKRYNIIYLINNPAISGSRVMLKENVKYSAQAGIILNWEYIDEDMNNIASIIVKLLSDLDFGYALTLFWFLSKNGEIGIFWDTVYNSTSIEWSYSKCIDIYKMIQSLRRYKLEANEGYNTAESKDVMIALISEFEKEFRELLIFLRGGKELSQTLNILLDALLSKAFDEIFKVLYNDLSEKENKEDSIMPYIKLYRSILFNTLAEKLTNKIFNEFSLIPLIDKKNEYEQLFAEETEMRKRLQIIIAIDKNRLWEDDSSIIVKKYIEKQLVKMFGNLEHSTETIVDISCFEESYKEFNNSYKGGKTTLAYELQEWIYGKFQKHGIYKIEFEDFIWMLHKIVKLAYSKAWYGREEAFAMLKELQNVKFESLNIKNTADGEKASEDIKIFYAFIHMYASYTFNEKKNMYLLGAEIINFSNDIYIGFAADIKNQIASFKTLLAREVDENVVSQFEKLFLSKGEKNVK